MCAQLERNVQSRAFDDYQVEWEEPVAMVSCIHRLSDRTMMDQKASHLPFRHFRTTMLYMHAVPLKTPALPCKRCHRHWLMLLNIFSLLFLCGLAACHGPVLELSWNSTCSSVSLPVPLPPVLLSLSLSLHLLSERETCHNLPITAVSIISRTQAS